MKASKGTGYLFKRSGTYYIRQVINGKRIVKTLNTGNKLEAEKKAKELIPIFQIKTKEELALRVSEAQNLFKTLNQVKLSTSWGTYLKNPTRPLSGKLTLAGYERDWQRFVDFVKVEFIDQVTESLAIAYMSTVLQKVSVRTYNSTLQAIKLVFGVLSPDSNPFSRLKSKKAVSISKKDFSEKQIESIFEVLDNPEIALMHKDEMRLMFMIGRWTGLRLKDCALLRWEDVFIADKLLKVCPWKTKAKDKKIIIPIHNTLHKALKKLKQEGEYVLTNVANRYEYNSSGVIKDSMYIINRAGIKSEATQKVKRARAICEYGFHSFRHSFVSFCAKAGVPMAIVQEIVGHGSPAMTRHYTHIGAETLRAAIDKL